MYVFLKITMPRGGIHEGIKISCLRFYFRNKNFKLQANGIEQNIPQDDQFGYFIYGVEDYFTFHEFNKDFKVDNNIDRIWLY